VFSQVPTVRQGLQQAGKFQRTVNYRDFADSLSKAKGFVTYWDNVAQAPYAYSARQQEFASFDDEKSIRLKARYVRAKHLGSVMFWELTGDKPQHGLQQSLYKAAQ
jgi:chitinase